MDAVISVHADDVWLALYIQPGAKKTAWCGWFDGAIKIRLAAPPVEGKANAALCLWIARSLSIPPRDVAVLRGQQSRHKIIVLKGWAHQYALIKAQLTTLLEASRNG